MAEGPLVHHYADRLDEVLAGRNVEVEFGIKRLKDRGSEFARARLDRVEAWGKQFHIYFSDGRVILVHLLMWGSWEVYGRGESWDKSREQARLILHTEDRVAVCFSAPIIEILDDGDVDGHPRRGGLGPDPLRDDFDREEALRRVRDEAERPIGPVLLDQTVMAGVGNILKNEILFHAGVHPKRTVDELSSEELEVILDWTIELCERWLNDMGSGRDWQRVYRRSGRPCPECGTEIEFFRQKDRVTYACPCCQPLAGRDSDHE